MSLDEKEVKGSVIKQGYKKMGIPKYEPIKEFQYIEVPRVYSSLDFGARTNEEEETNEH